LEPVKTVVTEYRSHRLECAMCGSLTRAEVPRQARSAFGERLGASMSLLVGKYRLSKRLVCEVLSDIGGVHVSVGSVSNLEQQMSAALKAPVEQAQQYVRNAQVVNADETGWSQGVKGGASCTRLAVGGGYGPGGGVPNLHQSWPPSDSGAAGDGLHRLAHHR
jgi:transposase